MPRRGIVSGHPEGEATLDCHPEGDAEDVGAGPERACEPKDVRAAQRSHAPERGCMRSLTSGCSREGLSPAVRDDKGAAERAVRSSARLSVVVGTYNRLSSLKRCVESVFAQTRTPAILYVTDAGSTDGTVEYLQQIASDRVIPILVGQRLGQARAYNDVFAIVRTPYVAWISDDNEIVNHGLDVAVEILDTLPKV